MPVSNPLTTVSAVAGDARAWLDRIWSTIADRGQAYARVPAASVQPLERARQLAATLLSGRGEASGAAVARELHNELLDLADADRAAFFRYLAQEFTPPPGALQTAAQAYLTEPTAEHAARLATAAEPPRQELLRRMNMMPGGTAALMAMRREVLGLVRAQPELKPLDADLQHLFASWFNRGFLELRRIDWQTPAAVLEKLIAYEAVHEIKGWDDLRRRLAADRRCFAFFHPALPGEPLIFVEVALTMGLANSIQPLLAPSNGDQPGGRGLRADTAIFYSISNCQDGLRGISFGNFLIKQVVEELKAELPSLAHFSTLSPVPGFRRWLDRKLRDEGAGLLRPDEAEALAAASQTAPATADAGQDVTADAGHLIAAATAGEWWADPARAAILRGPLTRLCAAYLTRPNTGMGGIDPVARFHLGNGARLERINWLGNTSPRGIEESFGLMVNYLYDPDTIEENHEAFVSSGRAVRSAAVEGLLASPVADGAAKARGSRLRGA